MLQLSIVGNLGADAEKKSVNGNEFVSFNVANTERWTTEDGTTHERTMWVSCIINGDGGKLLPYLKKGTTIYATGTRVSTRVYSSAKERGFVAGLNLTISHIELIGGKTDDVPARLYDAQGKQFDVTKHYWSADAGSYGQVLLDRSGRQFMVDNQGWVTAAQTQQPEPAPVEAKDAPFTGDNNTEEAKKMAGTASGKKGGTK